MRTRLFLVCSPLVFVLGADSGLPRPDPKVAEMGPNAGAVLQQASEIVLRQGKEASIRFDREMLQIVKLQARAGDFDGALRLIRAFSGTYLREMALVELAEAIARSGERDRALQVLGMLESITPSGRDYLEALVQLRWIEYLIASGDFAATDKAIGQLKSDSDRPAALARLAVAYGKRGDEARASKTFARAIAATTTFEQGYRVEPLVAIAEAQLSVGRAEAALETIRSHLNPHQFTDSWFKSDVLRQCAVVAAKANDQPTAHRLFREAVKVQESLSDEGKLGVLLEIAESQAAVGHTRDALETLRRCEKYMGTGCFHSGSALRAVVAAQVQENDVEGAARTASSADQFVQYRDDALHAIVDELIRKRDLRTALSMTNKVDSPSRRAAAILKVAVAHARSGDRRLAASTAERIRLTGDERFGGRLVREHFDYRQPETWGELYDSHPFFTLMSMDIWRAHAVEVAGKSMELSQVIGLKPEQSYAVLFNQIPYADVVQALARAHAASGNPTDALAWAEKMGSGAKVDSKDDYDARSAVERRVHALIGVAEGILDRSGKLSSKSPH